MYNKIEIFFLLRNYHNKNPRGSFYSNIFLIILHDQTIDNELIKKKCTCETIVMSSYSKSTSFIFRIDVLLYCLDYCILDDDDLN